MNEPMHPHDWADRLLDAHLRETNTAEPPLGYEARLRSRLQENVRPRRAWFWISWTAAALAVILIAVMLSTWTTQKPAAITAANPPVPATKAQRIAPVVTPTAAKRHATRVHRPATSATSIAAVDTRPAVFPTPTPLSEQEQLALAYLRRTPRTEMIAMSHPETDDRRDEVIPPQINQNLNVPAPQSIPINAR